MNHLEICKLGSTQSLTFMPLDPKPLDYSILIYAFIRLPNPNLGAQFLEAGPRVEDPVVTSVQPVQIKNSQESGTALTLWSHP